MTTLKENFQAAAVRIFNTFGSLIINATYLQEASNYVAGGNLTATTTSYAIRLIRDERRAELTLATDIPRNAVKYLMITAELPIPAVVNDRIQIGSDIKSIVAVETDPADAVTILYLG